MEEIKQRTARTLLKRLTSSSVPAPAALAEIRLLTKQDPDVRVPLADAGLVPVLTRLLLFEKEKPEHEDDDDDQMQKQKPKQHVQEDASATLLNLSISAPETLMSTPNLLLALSRALRLGEHHPAVAQHAAATLYSLLCVDAYRPIIGAKHAIVSALVALLVSPLSPTRSVKDALKALFALALYPLNRPAMVELGVIPAAFALVGRDPRLGVVEDATAVIAQVAGCHESLEGFRRVDGVRVLVELVGDERRGGRVRENAAAGLLRLAMSGGEEAVEEIREVDAAEEVVRGMVEAAGEGSERGRRKGEELLRVLERGRSWNLSRMRRFSEELPGPMSRSSSSLVGSNVSF